jgi:hypothetical protein
MKLNLDYWKLGGQDFAMCIKERMTCDNLNLISLFIIINQDAIWDQQDFDTCWTKLLGKARPHGNYAFACVGLG